MDAMERVERQLHTDKVLERAHSQAGLRTYASNRALRSGARGERRKAKKLLKQGEACGFAFALVPEGDKEVPLHALQHMQSRVKKLDHDSLVSMHVLPGSFELASKVGVRRKKKRKKKRDAL